MHCLPAPLNGRADALVAQEDSQAVPVFRFDLVVLVDIKVFIVGVRTGRQDKVGAAGQASLVGRCQPTPLRDAGVVRLQLEFKNSGLKIIQPTVDAPQLYVAVVSRTSLTPDDLAKFREILAKSRPQTDRT